MICSSASRAGDTTALVGPVIMIGRMKVRLLDRVPIGRSPSTSNEAVMLDVGWGAPRPYPGCIAYVAPGHTVVFTTSPPPISSMLPLRIKLSYAISILPPSSMQTVRPHYGTRHSVPVRHRLRSAQERLT